MHKRQRSEISGGDAPDEDEDESAPTRMHLTRRLRFAANDSRAWAVDAASQSTSTATDVIARSTPAAADDGDDDDDDDEFADMDERDRARLDRPLAETATWLLEAIREPSLPPEAPQTTLERYVYGALASEDATPIVGYDPTLKTFALYNKHYGAAVSMRVKATTDAEFMFRFSAFYPSTRTANFSVAEWWAEPSYGGLRFCGTADVGDEKLYVARPLLMCTRSRLVRMADRGFGWRSLLYENKGADDPFPTGIVALEAFVYRRNDDGTLYFDPATSEPVLVADDAERRARIEAVVRYANELAATSPHEVLRRLLASAAKEEPAAAATAEAVADEDTDMTTAAGNAPRVEDADDES